ncbi:MAG: AAA family ATPase [Chloroflexi bacterium]|nr:AAA family ATPase [Ktedonobacteraceae bacterium]MBV9019628.1 AAA family ATPase [Ktedonobacteraceae bacterium]MBV9708714.1 AAA family ATPase [Chloroflexota bacterium]
MITQIEIDGFKTFKDFKVELAPFQVIVGPNGSGKSNLFDALQLLSRLVETDLLSAFQGLRGNPREMFHKFPDGRTSNRIRLAVEMLVDRRTQDELENVIELNYRRMRYEVEIAWRPDELGQLYYVTHESLKTIPKTTDSWLKRYKLDIRSNQIPKSKPDTTFISYTESNLTVWLDRQQQPLEKDEGTEPTRQAFSFPKSLDRTILSRSLVASMSHATAARKELGSLSLLQLNPEALRRPSSTESPRFLATNGSNLPATLARMEAEDKFALTDVSRDMANLVPGIFTIRVKKNEASNEYGISAETSDGRSFPAQVLSDGTLRLLAIATLRNDPKFHGVLCMEEPENGVDTLHLQNMTRLLREMATDFTDVQQADEPLRQVLITTHSPTFISQPNVIDSLLLTLTPTHIQGENAQPLRITKMVPVTPPSTLSASATGVDRDKKIEIYTIDMVKKYLSTDNLDEALDQLQKVRDSLIQQ